MKKPLKKARWKHSGRVVAGTSQTGLYGGTLSRQIDSKQRADGDGDDIWDVWVNGGRSSIEVVEAEVAGPVATGVLGPDGCMIYRCMPEKNPIGFTAEIFDTDEEYFQWYGIDAADGD